MQYSGSVQAIGNPADIVLVCKWLPGVMIGESVVRIDRHEFVPDTPGFLDLTEMVLAGEAHWTIAGQRFRLTPGDWLIVFSDGVSEAMSANGDEYGEERILAVVDKEISLAPADLLKALFADVRVFTKGAPQSDDITALVLRYGSPA